MRSRDYLFSYLSQFENEEINYNIEINDVGVVYVVVNVDSLGEKIISSA